MRLRHLLAATCWLTTAPAAAETMRCAFVTRSVCSEGGCRPVNPGEVRVVIDFAGLRYGRCDGTERQCDWYPMTVRPSGAWLYLEFGHGGQGAKVSPTGRPFIETVGLGELVFVGHGRCEK